MPAKHVADPADLTGRSGTRGPEGEAQAPGPSNLWLKSPNKAALLRITERRRCGLCALSRWHALWALTGAPAAVGPHIMSLG
jgi:hypothetical protein